MILGTEKNTTFWHGSTVYNSLNTEVEQFRANTEARVAVMRTQVLAIAQKLFDKWPELQAFKWAQYRPYDDRDSFYIPDSDSRELDIKYGDILDWREIYDMEDPEDDEHPNEAMFSAHDDVSEFLGWASKSLGHSMYLFEELFGNDVEVVLHRDGTVVTDDYSEHD